METVLALIFIIFGILQIILFFKIWSMTNDVSDIKKLLISTIKTPNRVVDNNITHDGWTNNTTDKEKEECEKIIPKLKPNQVIVYVFSKNKIETWSFDFWNSEKNNPDYKLLYKSPTN